MDRTHDLEIELAHLAARWRSTPEGEDDEVIREYHRVFAELVRIAGEIVALDPDAELPDELMPDEYVEHWKEG